MATTKGRQGSHGKAYSEYAGMKDKAIYVGGEHLDCDTFIDSNTPDMEEIWYEFEQEGSFFPNIKNTCIMLESSPTPEEMESMGIHSTEDALTEEQRKALMQYSKDLLDNMDKQKINYNSVVQIKQKDANGKVIRDADGNPVTRDEIRKGVVPKTHLRNSKWFCMLHRDSKSGIWHLHILASRFTKDGLEQNDPRLIAKRAARATEMLNQNRGWKSAEDISSHHQNEIKDTIYDVLRKMDKFSWDNFKEAVEARTFRNYKGEVDNYELMFRNDSHGNVVGYSVWRGNSNYNASKIGRQLTAARIFNTWQELHDEQKQTKTEKTRFKPTQSTSYNPSRPIITDAEKKRLEDEEYHRLMEEKKLASKHFQEESQQEKEARSAVDGALQILKDFCSSTFNVFDREEWDELHEGIVGQCLLGGRDTTRNNLEEAVGELVEMANGIAEQAVKATDMMMEFVADIALPATTPSVGGGGGGQDTGGWRDKRDDEWWDLWKPRFAKFRSRGYGRR